jgi:putative ABC transport system ATP-binding protein
MDLFKTLNKEGQTIVMVSHYPENIAFSTRTIPLKDGRLGG